MSNSCFMLGKLEESARAFDQAYYLDAKDVRTGVVKGLSLLKSGKFDDALRCFSRCYGCPSKIEFRYSFYFFDIPRFFMSLARTEEYGC